MNSQLAFMSDGDSFNGLTININLVFHVDRRKCWIMCKTELKQA